MFLKQFNLLQLTAWQTQQVKIVGPKRRHEKSLNKKALMRNFLIFW